TPSSDRAPRVGLYPTTPQKLAGRMMDPCVWVPKAAGNIPAAVPAAEPEEDPPGVWSGSCGLHVGPERPIANSVVTVFARGIAPPSSRARTAAASPRATWSA